jgi:antitoxin YefM
MYKVATLVDMSVVEQMALKDVKNHLSEVVDKVEREHERVVITKHGRPAAVVVSVDDLESLEQTLDILSRPALIKQIRESVDDLQGEGAEALSKDEALALIPRS